VAASRSQTPPRPPSDDTFRRIFTVLDPKAFVECFTAHVRSIRPDLVDELIAIDGKTLRHSFDHGDPESSLHLISAWADGFGLTLGQLLVDGKTKGNQVRHHDPGPEESHGRIEQRVVKATDYLDWFEPAERKHWLGLRTLVEMTSTRQLKGQTSTEKR
jgi:hypothetical protein